MKFFLMKYLQNFTNVYSSELILNKIPKKKQNGKKLKFFKKIFEKS